MRLLTLGQIDRAYDRLAAHIRPGQRVLDVGCGTGALTVRAAERGAHVRGIDVSARMLDQARRHAERCACAGRIELLEMSVAELDREPAESYCVVASALCLSELTDRARAFALVQAYRLLTPGGLLLLADEVVPQGIPRRVLNTVVRLPLAILTYLLTQTVSHSLSNIVLDVEQVGFEIQSYRLNRLRSLAELVALKPVVGVWSQSRGRL
jgi:demethylmenaquinone methyltransferase/2-methoxy-6-polyprenyl-1,4-benzoquinol methylase